MIKKLLIIFSLTLILLIGMIELKYDISYKIKHIGNNPTDAFFNLYQILRKENLINTFKKIFIKFNNDPRLGLKYSLYNKESYPEYESEKKREALPQFKFISGLNVNDTIINHKYNHSYNTWYRSHGDNFSSKYSSLNQINQNNVKNLKVAWKYISGPYKYGSSVQTNPIIVNDRLFVTTTNNYLLSINNKTGKEIWRIKLPSPIARRGLTWEPNDNFLNSRLFVPTGNGVFSIYAATGKIQLDFGKNGQVGNQLSKIAPIITENKLIVAPIKPSIEAYDLNSGKLLWSTQLLEKINKKNSLLTGGVPWGGMSYDQSRSRIYLSTGNPRPELIGLTRPGKNRNTCSVISINANNGKIDWAFQEVAHDLWDFDIPSPPILTTITKDGRKIDVVATVTKIGNTLLLDRDFGKPIFDFRLKKAPISIVPGEKTHPYQPAVELPEPFLKLVFEKSDITNISNNANENIKQKIKNAKFGFFEPPIIGSKIVLYGPEGGAQWPGAAVNPKTNILYIPSTQIPWIIRLKYRDLKKSTRSYESINGNVLYQEKCGSCHGAKLSGTRETSSNGGFYYPSLTGITILRSHKNLTSLKNFNNNHANLKVETKVNKEDLEKIFNYFSELDQKIDKDRSFALFGTWEELLDDKGFPGTKPPWGYLTALNLNNGKKVWQIPFGEYKELKRNGIPIKGQPNRGGVIVTGGGLIFATGTIDKKLRAIDSYNGKELWSYVLPVAGSAPPSTYMIDESQYIVVVASREDKNKLNSFYDNIIAFKLPNN